MRLLERCAVLVAGAQAVNAQPATPQMYEFAEAAYHRHVAWFGPPVDAGRKYEIISANIASISIGPIRRTYAITFRNQSKRQEEIVASLAHEMYHRVTMGRRKFGLHKIVWIDETLAFLASQRFLQEQGMQDYAENKLRQFYKYPVRLDMDSLYAVRRRPGSFDPTYPPGFANTVGVLGDSLESIAGWEHVCNIIRCRTWREWMQPLPAKSQEVIKGMLKTTREPGSRLL